MSKEIVFLNENNIKDPHWLKDATVLKEVVTVDGDTLSKTLQSGTFYIFDGALVSLTLLLANNTPSDILPVYCGRFTTDEDFHLYIGTTQEYPNGEISFDDDTTYEFYIVDGIISFSKIDTSGDNVSTAYPIVTLSVGRGSFTTARTHADAHPDAYFQWLLEQGDGQGNTIRKIIWHIPANSSITGDTDKFIDALGSIIDFS